MSRPNGRLIPSLHPGLSLVPALHPVRAPFPDGDAVVNPFTIPGPGARMRARRTPPCSREENVVDFTPEEAGERPGEAAVFWSWIALLGIGLAYMIAVPLMGR